MKMHDTHAVPTTERELTAALLRHADDTAHLLHELSRALNATNAANLPQFDQVYAMLRRQFRTDRVAFLKLIAGSLGVLPDDLRT